MFCFKHLIIHLIVISSCLSQNVKWTEDLSSTEKSNRNNSGKIKFDDDERSIGLGKGEVSSGRKADRKGGSKVNEVNKRQYGFSSGQFSSFNQPFQFQSSFSFDNFPQLIPSTEYIPGGGIKWNWEPPWASHKTTRKPSTVHFPGESGSPKMGTSIGSSTYSNGRRGTATVVNSPKFNESCNCGVIQFEKDSKKLQRIVGGTISKDNSWPWMVSIAYVGEMGQRTPFWFCGASLISDKFAMTAAHCLKTMKSYGLSNIKLIMGTNNLLDSKAAVHYSVRSVRAHPLYKSGTEEYDFALIETKETVKFNSKIAPICLRQEDDTYVNRTVTVAGWGTLQNGDGPPSDLREVDLKIVSNEMCQKEYYTNYRTPVTSDMICAWLPGKDSCQGDSGGPLFLKTRVAEPHAYTQVGIVSFGPPVELAQFRTLKYFSSDCGVTTIPGVYSRVSSAIPWIKSVTKNGRFCKGSF